MLSIVSATILSSCASAYDKNALALIKDNNSVCEDEIVKNISLMLNSDKVIFNKNSFKKDSYLYLNNQKVSELKIKPSNSSKYVTFVLYKEDGRCMLALIDKNHKIEKSHQLTKCSCIKSKSL
jgi:hypothetical protein